MSLKSPGKILVIIPTYNEAENIGIVIPKVLEWSPDSEILVVDDNSPDGTFKNCGGHFEK